MLAAFNPSTPARLAPKAAGRTYSGSRQTCLVDAPSTYRHEARELWCNSGQVAKVTVRTDTRNYIVQVHLSPAGESAWRASPGDLAARFQHIVNDVAQRVRMNVAVTVRSPDDKRLAVCSRDLIARTATCVIR